MRKTLYCISVLWGLVLLCVGIFGAPARADSTPFRFVVVAAGRSNHNNPSVNSTVLRQLIADMNALNPAFCLFPGDLVYGGKVGNDPFKKQLQEWVAATSEFKGIIYVTPGNHELKGGAGRADAWREMFPNMPDNGPPGVQYKSSYYFNYGNSRFISTSPIGRITRRESIRSGWIRSSGRVAASSTSSCSVTTRSGIWAAAEGLSGSHWSATVSMPISAAIYTFTTGCSREITVPGR